MRTWGLSAAQQDEVWGPWRSGESLGSIAREIGHRRSSVRWFIAETGGVRRPAPERSSRSLSAHEREEISRGVAAGKSYRAIATVLGRAPSTMSREVARNSGPGRYHAQAADAAAYRRAQRPKPPQGRGRLKDMVLISERPAEVADRAVPGHWEGDLLLGMKTTAVGTLVERSSRYVMLFALPDGYAADQVRHALTQTIATLPHQLRRSLTWDQGPEMAEHISFTVDTGVTVHFCDPRSPWQRASNENTNRLLRQHLTKGSDFRAVTQDQLNLIAAELNGRPRRTLAWTTPSAAFTEAVMASAASTPPCSCLR